MPNLNFCEIHQTIKKAKNILLVAHGQPDVDTTASVCALKEYFISANIESTVYCADPIPAHFNFMPSAMTAINKTQLKFNEYDVVIICDCGSIKKTTLITEINNKLKGQTIINIDHHPQVDHFFDINMRDIEASSTCEIIYNFLIANNLNINKKIAECLLAGIISDTKNFLYTKKNSANLLMSARLLEKGANWSKIMTAIHYNKDLNSLKLWGETMISIKLNKKYNIISSNITLDKMQSVDGE
ncbi:MAG: DHH family phosphoesterase, partial [Candidatus Falkowbacteria bacterium]|nr:DHH family phosphoesterase [Candidatus Falkowbacteria bacterium]